MEFFKKKKKLTNYFQFLGTAVINMLTYIIQNFHAY